VALVAMSGRLVAWMALAAIVVGWLASIRVS
jgi:hypothetical protein